MTGKFRLTKLDLNEISLVGAGDDPTAKVMIFKSEPTEDDDTDDDEVLSFTKGCSRAHKAGKRCTACGEMGKGMPEGSSMKVDAPLGDDFKMSRKMKRRKRRKMLIEPPIVDAGTANMVRKKAMAGGYNELREMITSAWRAQGGGDSHVEDFGPNWAVIYSYASTTVGGRSEYMKVPYAIRQGAVVFGTPQKIERRTVWVLAKESLLKVARDGDGDGFIHDGTPRQRPAPPFRPNWKGKPVKPNPIGPGAKPNPAQADTDATIAAAEAVRSLSSKVYDTPEAATADLSSSWERTGGMAIGIKNKKTGVRMHLTGGGSKGFHWEVTQRASDAEIGRMRTFKKED